MTIDGVHISFRISAIVFFRKMPRSRIARAYGEGNSNPLQYPCLENPRDRGALCTVICGVSQGWTRLKQLSSSMAVIFLIFGGSSILFSTVAAQIYALMKSTQRSLFSIFLITLVICCLSDNTHFERSEVTPLCNFNFHFLDY